MCVNVVIKYQAPKIISGRSERINKHIAILFYVAIVMTPNNLVLI
jgi:hypothetical protein